MRQELPSSAIRESLKQIQISSIYTLPTKQYRESYLSNSDANSIPWEEFRLRTHPLYQVDIPDTNLEALIVPKSRTWSEQDINIYFGSSESDVRAIQDLSERDFNSIFNWQIRIASKLSNLYGSSVNVAHGFNPEDSAPDAHSVRNKFHTHIYIPDVEHRQQADISSLSWFDRLKLIEPYAHVFSDYATYKSKELSNIGILQTQEGFFSVTSTLSNVDNNYFRILYDLMKNMRAEYDAVVSTCTTGETEVHTGHCRYVPFSIEERRKRIEEYIKLNTNWLSEKSKRLLVGLVNQISNAEPRLNPQSTRIDSSSQLWIAKGFSGAMNFAVSSANDTVRFDFAPRVVSTSGATKFITSERTIVVKDADPATNDDVEKLQEYESRIVEVAMQTSL